MRRSKRVPATDDRDIEEIRAHGRLPNADVDVIYRRTREEDGAFIGIAVRTLPASETFGRLLAMSDPFRFWGQLAAAAWQPWLQGLRAMSSPPAPTRRLRSDRKE